MTMEQRTNELLEVQIKNNNKILVSENLESTQTKGNFSAEPIGNLQAIVFYDGHFAAFDYVKMEIIIHAISKWVITIILKM
jgi:hypothetical protein